MEPKNVYAEHMCRPFGILFNFANILTFYRTAKIFSMKVLGNWKVCGLLYLCCQFPLTPNYKAMAELLDGTLDFEARLTLVSSDVRKLQEQLSEITLL